MKQSFIFVNASSGIPFLAQPPMRTSPLNRVCSAYSLIEILTVVAILGVLTAMALPTISSLVGASTQAKNKRNAQLIAAMSAEATAAGVDHVVPEEQGGIEATVQKLREGLSFPDGMLGNQIFMVSNLSDEELQQAKPYLRLSKDPKGMRMVYIGSGEP